MYRVTIVVWHYHLIQCLSNNHAGPESRVSATPPGTGHPVPFGYFDLLEESRVVGNTRGHLPACRTLVKASKVKFVFLPTKRRGTSSALRHKFVETVKAIL